MDCTAAGLKVGDQGGTPCTHTGVTGTSLATSNHWDIGTGMFTSHLNDKNKDKSFPWILGSMLEVLHTPGDLVCWGGFETMTGIRKKNSLARTDSNFCTV